MKLSVSSYSFGSYAQAEVLGILGVMEKARDMGFEGFEIAECPEIYDADTVEAIRKRSEELSLPIVALDVGADFTKNSCTSLDEEIQRVCALVDIADALGTKMLRHDVCYGNFDGKHGVGFEDVLPVIVKGCRAVADYAEGLGIVTMFENHGYFVQDSDRVERLINAVAHPSFGYLLDVGNFMCVDEEPTLASGRLARYACHAHAKDFHKKSGSTEFPGEGWFTTRGGNYLRGAIIGHGDACCAQSIKLLKASGYDGYLTIEFEGLEDNLRGISLGLENLRKYID